MRRHLDIVPVLRSLLPRGSRYVGFQAYIPTPTFRPTLPPTFRGKILPRDGAQVRAHLHVSDVTSSLLSLRHCTPEPGCRMAVADEQSTRIATHDALTSAAWRETRIRHLNCASCGISAQLFASSVAHASLSSALKLTSRCTIRSIDMVFERHAPVKLARLRRMHGSRSLSGKISPSDAQSCRNWSRQATSSGVLVVGKCASVREARRTLCRHAALPTLSPAFERHCSTAP
eukprot:3800033-Pleurochrysis_carterae.AAC.1